tara:strand:+ start:6643 stop:7011 length:369 start_codon:yes stop_codon:yes gene_type:complete
MINIKNIILITTIVALNSYSIHGQTWDENFYNKKVLYENSELLQMSEHDKKKLEKNIENETYYEEFYSNQATSSNLISTENKKEVTENKVIFSDMVESYKDIEIPSENNLESVDENLYFINF